MIETPPRAGQYGVVLADCPWRYATWSDKGRGRCPDGRWIDGQGNRWRADGPKHYETMSIGEIMSMPVAEMAAQDCVLFLWAIKPMLPVALDVGKAWGFTYKTRAFVWVKTTRHGKRHVGMGHWTRANPEDCLLFTRGKPKRLAKDVRELIEAPRREHSRKPDETYQRIERLCAGPYLELFARTERAGWDSIGAQRGRWRADQGAHQELGLFSATGAA